MLTTYTIVGNKEYYRSDILISIITKERKSNPSKIVPLNIKIRVNYDKTLCYSKMLLPFIDKCQD
jgi:hypothetical protein